MHDNQDKDNNPVVGDDGVIKYRIKAVYNTYYAIHDGIFNDFTPPIVGRIGRRQSKWYNRDSIKCASATLSWTSNTIIAFLGYIKLCVQVSGKAALAYNVIAVFRLKDLLCGIILQTNAASGCVTIHNRRR